eukprot:UN31674
MILLHIQMILHRHIQLILLRHIQTILHRHIHSPRMLKLRPRALHHIKLPPPCQKNKTQEIQIIMFILETLILIAQSADYLEIQIAQAETLQIIRNSSK